MKQHRLTLALHRLFNTLALVCLQVKLDYFDFFAFDRMRHAGLPSCRVKDASEHSTLPSYCSTFLTSNPAVAIFNLDGASIQKGHSNEHVRIISELFLVSPSIQTRTQRDLCTCDIVVLLGK